MRTQVQEYRIEARTSKEQKRLQAIREGLKRGDKKKIAGRLGVWPEWVSRVISGIGTSEPILQAAEQLISERESQTIWINRFKLTPLDRIKLTLSTGSK